MEFKQRLHQALVFSREVTEAQLADLKTPKQWVTVAVEGSNHPLWIVGHLAVADDFFVSLMEPSRADPRAPYQAKFGRGSQPVADPSAYPDSSEILAYLRDRRQEFLEVLDGMDESALETPTPENAPPFMHDFGSVFQLAVWHESMHTGQLTLVRRKLGHGPMR